MADYWNSNGDPRDSLTTAILNNRPHPGINEYARGESTPVEGVALMPVFGEKYLRRLYVIVETYHHKNYGRGKRRWMSEFTPKERKVVSNWYLRIYAWMMRTGIPVDGVRMKLTTYATLCKAADFFASI